MSSLRVKSFYHWCLTGTLAGSLILGGAILSQAGPLRLPGRSTSKADSDEAKLQQIQAARLAAARKAADEDESAGKSSVQDSRASAEAKIANSAKTVKLFYLEASWKQVLNDYADQVGTELVADPKLIPRKRFSRRDRGYYTPAEALKVLNKELQSLDVKIVPKGDHLELVDLPSAGPKYRPAVIGDLGGMNEHEIDESKITRLGETNKAPKRMNRAQTAAAEEFATDDGPNAPGRIRLTNGTETRAISPRTVSVAANTNLKVRLMHRRTQEIANTLYHAFEKDAEVVNNGPLGLPAIRVYETPPATRQRVGRIALAPPKKQLRFAIAMDHDNGQLLVQANPATAAAVEEMVQMLDAPDARRTNVQLFVSAQGDQVKDIAKTVQKQISRLVRAQAQRPLPKSAVAYQGEGVPPGAQDDDAQAQDQAADQDAQPSNRPPPAARRQPGNQPPAGAGGLEEKVIGIKGDVTVEVVPGLGVMVLKGNKQDVEDVMKLIEEIERLSAGMIPDVHLLLLKHTNSEALAELLTQVYDRLNGGRPGAAGAPAAPGGAGRQSVTVLPVVKPNAVLIVAAEADMEAVLRLAEELDQPTDPDAEFQVFRLKSAVADQVLQTVQTFYEDRTSNGTRVLAVADVRTNSLLVHATPNDLKEVAKLISQLDSQDTAAVSMVRMFQLKNAVATETADVLLQTINSVLNPPRQGGTGQQGGGNQFGGGGGGGGGAGAAGTGNAALREVKSTVLQFLAEEGPGSRLLQSGILADIRITADGRTNSLIVTAPEASMLLLEELIKRLDRPTSTVAAIRHFELRNADARSMVTLLEGLFATANGQNQNAQDRLGIQVAGAEDASSGLIPLKFSVDPRTNSLIAIGAEESLGVVEAILFRLDESDVRQRESIVFRLKNAPATDVATAVNNFLTSQRDLAQSGDGLVSPFEQIEREVIVVPERISNTLLISATPRYFKEIKDLVVSLDSPPQQVTIQALLVEVTLSNTDEFGVELGLQDSVLFKRSVVDQLTTLNTTNTSPNGVQTTTQNVISQTSIPGFLFNNQQLGNNTTVNPGIVGKQSLTSFSLGRQNGELGYGGLVLAAGSESVSVLLRALAATQRVDVLSRPQIRTLDNQLAVIQVGQEVPVVSSFTNTGLTVSPVVEIRQAGIILQVVPRISPDGRVVMDVAAERSQYLPEDQGVTIFSDPATGRTIRAPRKDISTARASVAVSNEQTVVLGGMISSTNTSIQRKVPGIGDLPFLGLPFRYTFTQNVKKELLIFLTPRVIKTDADSELIKQVETARIHFMEQDAEEIHGPIFAAPPPADPLNPVTPAPVSTAVPLIDDPATPTTTVPPEVIVPAPPVPSNPDDVKLMRHISTKPRARRVPTGK